MAVVNINNNIAEGKHQYNDINTSNVECLRDLSYLQKIRQRILLNALKKVMRTSLMALDFMMTVNML